MEADGLTIYPCCEANAKNFTTFNTTPKIMDLQGKELLDPKAAKAHGLRKGAQNDQWQATKNVNKEKSEKKNEVTFTIYTMYPPSLQDKDQATKDGLQQTVVNARPLARVLRGLILGLPVPHAVLLALPGGCRSLGLRVSPRRWPHPAPMCC